MIPGRISWPLDAGLSCFRGDRGTRDTQPTYEADDYFVFGSESSGLPASILENGVNRSLPFPGAGGSQSVNTVAIVVYEAWRQQLYREG